MRDLRSLEDAADHLTTVDCLFTLSLTAASGWWTCAIDAEGAVERVQQGPSESFADFLLDVLRTARAMSEPQAIYDPVPPLDEMGNPVG